MSDPSFDVVCVLDIPFRRVSSPTIPVFWYCSKEVDTWTYILDIMHACLSLNILDTCFAY